MKKVYIVHGSQAYSAMLHDLGYEVVDDWANADMMMFTGGADVSPNLYGEQPHPSTSSNGMRDEMEILMWKLAKDNNLPCVGICRGGQFLNVMNGGQLYQHVYDHAIGGTHKVWSETLGTSVDCTSTHHQMMRMGAGATLEGHANGLSSVKESMAGSDIVYTRHVVVEPEVVWYENTRSLCFQPHPEFYGAHSTRTYFEHCLNTYMWRDEDVQGTSEVG